MSFQPKHQREDVHRLHRVKARMRRLKLSHPPVVQ